MRCSICKRRTIDAWAKPAWLWNRILWRFFYGRMDCGGDCYDCMKRIERF